MGDIAEALGDAVEKARASKAKTGGEGQPDKDAEKEASESRLNTIIAACVAIAATFMAICNVKDGNVCQAIAQAQTKSVDAWSYYQAKGTKENLAELTVDQLTIQRDLGAATAAPEAKKLLDDKIAEYAAKAQKYAGEKAEIKKQAEDYEKSVDELNIHDDQFDMAEAAISIGIALFGVTALTQKKWLLVIGLVFAGFGVFLGVAGFAGWSIHPDFLAKLLS
ncbi:MAG: DUF4337 domain-containing protein [Polyangiaceae bacterium]